MKLTYGDRRVNYLKVIHRDWIGPFMSRQACEELLNRWVAQYVAEDEPATLEMRVRYPLRSACVYVVDDKQRPGCYKVVASLWPRFQLGAMDYSLKLVADLPPPLQN